MAESERAGESRRTSRTPRRPARTRRTAPPARGANRAVRPERRAPRPEADDVLAWARDCLGEYFTEEPAPFHGELFRALADPRRRLVACVAPRGHAKSTCAALAFPLWCICERRAANIVIVTQAAGLAVQFVRDIRQELETNERLRARYGELCRPAPPARTARAGANARTARPRSSQRIFTTVTGVTVQAKGTGGDFRGLRVGPRRPDLVVCDDLEKDEQVRSAAGRAKLENWLRRVVMPALAPDGKLVVLGSLLHNESLLASLRDRRRFPGWEYQVYRALEAEALPAGGYRLVPLWPARWPVARLEEERARIGVAAFEQEYQANPVDDDLRTFQPEWLRPYEPSTLVEERLVNLMAVDPATGAHAGDFFALWVGSLDPADGVLYTRQLTLERIRIVEQVERILAAFERWRPVQVAIETNAYQVTLKQAVEEESRKRGLFIPVVGSNTRSEKKARIQGSSVFFANGQFRLPAGLDPEVERQFLQFPLGGHDDAPDVCAMGIELARQLRTRTIDVAVRPRAAPDDA